MTRENFKVCSCCQKEFKTEADYEVETKFLGTWDLGLSDDGVALFQEMRNCKCDSTLSFWLVNGKREATLNA